MFNTQTVTEPQPARGTTTLDHLSAALDVAKLAIGEANEAWIAATAQLEAATAERERVRDEHRLAQQATPLDFDLVRRLAQLLEDADLRVDTEQRRTVERNRMLQHAHDRRMTATDAIVKGQERAAIRRATIPKQRAFIAQVLYRRNEKETTLRDAERTLARARADLERLETELRELTGETV